MDRNHFRGGYKFRSCSYGVPVASTLKRARKEEGGLTSVTETVDRQHLWEAQTPQVFRRDWLLEAYAQRAGFLATDDAQLVERIKHPITLLEGSPLNRKITTRQDLKLARQILKVLPKPKASGTGNPFADDDLFR